MLACFSADGQIDYLPIGLTGSASTAGSSVWGALIDAFPDLSNQVSASYFDPTAQVVVLEVTISGTQAKDAFGIRNLGRHFDLSHVFIIQVGDDGLIQSMKAYWDNAQWFQSLGRSSLDSSN